MTETHVGFLYNAASCLLQSENSTLTLLRSYFLMRCDEIAKTAELPNRYFSPKVRCPHCCVEWNNQTVIKVNSRKLSKQQRRRLRLKADKRKDSNLLKDLSCNKELEQICSFCKHSTNIPLEKLHKGKEFDKVAITKDKSKHNDKTTVDNKAALNKKKKSQESSINVYASSKDIFSLKNNDNTLNSTVKQQPKVIKNNKKKKDKFAGLCQNAVLATAKLKEEQKKQNKLNLFLKPSI